ncbi:hypothetical protein TNCV_2285151 [Trichonephila clavipes]|nr:hypothetical protein TNCV_2285151 [Trichonephila clavipes]
MALSGSLPQINLGVQDKHSRYKPRGACNYPVARKYPLLHDPRVHISIQDAIFKCAPQHFHVERHSLCVQPKRYHPKHRNFLISMDLFHGYVMDENLLHVLSR